MDNVFVILRFLGTTPQTSNMFETIRSIMYQLIKLFEIQYTRELNSLDNFRDLRNEFREMLFSLEESIVAKSQHIIFFLESIDQLNESDYNLDWFISKLPKNVKFVYSTLTNHGDIIEQLIKKHSVPRENFLEIECLNYENSMQILKLWLEKKNKNYKSFLNSDYLIKLFKNAKLYPLYIKLVYEIITITSCFNRNDAEISKLLTIDDCIYYLFRLLDKNHEKCFFSNCMFYITIFKDGISQMELEDLLSIDDDVLCEIYKRHETGTRRFPSSLWVRFKNDFKEYLCEKQIDGVKVISWYHRKFSECARKLYIDSLPKVKKDRLITNIIHLYLETWSRTPKPYTHSETVIKKKNLKSTYQIALRNTGIENLSEIGYSQRRLKQLVYFIFMLNNHYLKINGLKSYIYYNYDFMFSLFKSKDYSFFTKYTNELWNDHAKFSNHGNNPLNVLVLVNNIYVQNLKILQTKPNLMSIILKSTLFNRFDNSLEIDCLLRSFQKQAIEKQHSLLLAPNYNYMPIISNGNSRPIFYSDFKIKYLIPFRQTPLLLAVAEKIYLIDTKSCKILDEMSLTAFDINNLITVKILMISEPEIEKLDSLKISDLNGILYIFKKNKISMLDFRVGKIKSCGKFEEEKILASSFLSTNHLLLKIISRERDFKYYTILNVKQNQFIVSFSKKVNIIKTNVFDYDVFLEPDSHAKCFLVASNFDKTFQVYYFNKSEEHLQILNSIPVLGMICDLLYIGRSFADQINNFSVSVLRVFLKFDKKDHFIVDFHYNESSDKFKMTISKLDNISIKNVLDFKDNIMITESCVLDLSREFSV